MDKNTNDILESLDFLKNKIGEVGVDVKELRSEMETGFRELRAENLSIIQKLDTLAETVSGMKGYAKEIDELRNRVNVVELKLQKALG